MMFDQSQMCAPMFSSTAALPTSQSTPPFTNASPVFPITSLAPLSQHQGLPLHPPSTTAAAASRVVPPVKALALKQMSVSCENIPVSIVKRDALVYAAELDINNLPVSVCQSLIRSSFHAQLGVLTGAHITVKGKYFSVEQKLKFTVSRRPLPHRTLYLDITAQNINSVETSLNHLSTSITSEMQKQASTSKENPVNAPNVSVNFAHTPIMTPAVHLGTAPASVVAPVPVTDKLNVGINGAPPSFNLILKLLGDNNVNLNYIESQSGTEISIRGIGSGFLDPVTKMEISEPLHFYIVAKDVTSLNNAKGLLKNLLEATKSDLRNHIAQLAPPKVAAPWRNSFKPF